MTTTRRMIVLAAFVSLVTLGACNKPTHDECEKAIDHMRVLLGTENLKEQDIEGEIRRCRGGSSKTAVECATKATSLDELKACDFMKIPDKKK